MTSHLLTVRRVLREAPCSTRALARAAGLSPALLTRIAKGERSLTPATAKALAKGLRGWAKDCDRLARQLDRVANALSGHRET